MTASWSFLAYNSTEFIRVSVTQQRQRRWPLLTSLMVSTLIHRCTCANFNTPLTNDKANELERSVQSTGVKREPTLINTGIKDICPSPLLPLSFLFFAFLFLSRPPLSLSLQAVKSDTRLPRTHFVFCALLLSFAFKGWWIDRSYLSIILLFSSQMQINVTTCGEH